MLVCFSAHSPIRLLSLISPTHLQVLLSKQGGFGRPSKQVLTLVLLWLRVGMWTIPGRRAHGLAPKAFQRPGSPSGQPLFGPWKGRHSLGVLSGLLKLRTPFWSGRRHHKEEAGLGAAGPCPSVSWDYAFMAEGSNRSGRKRAWNPRVGRTGLWEPKWPVEKIPTALVCRFLSLSHCQAERGLLLCELRTHTPYCSPDGHVKPETGAPAVSEDEDSLFEQFRSYSYYISSSMGILSSFHLISLFRLHCKKKIVT